MISFAQNFEDVILRRLFKDQEAGFYVDLGCGDPLLDNVTLDLYRRGWHGLVVDADPSVLLGYSISRPRDVVRQAWLWSKQRKKIWHPSEVVGWSRLSKGNPRDSSDPRSVEVTTTPLSTLLCEGVFPQIDLLKIDCEGAELEILRGSNLRRYRPRVVIVETLNPHPTTLSNRRLIWFLRVRGYKKCLFDGINLFFCDRRERDIVRKLSYPVSVLDMPFHRYQQALAMGWVDGQPSDDLPM